MTDMEKLIALEAIRNLKARYYRLMDTKQWLEWGNLFSLDAIMDVSDDVKENINAAPVVQGRAVIVAQVSGLIGGACSVHQVHSPEIELRSSTEATAIWAMEDWLTFPPGMAVPFKSMHGCGHYHEAYQADAGRWFIKSLKLTRLKQDFIAQ